MKQIILKYDHAEISYGGKTVVQDVSFSLHKGEILGIVGESGSGKSTLLKAALGLLGNSGLVTKGDIRFENQNLPELSEKEMRRIRGAGMGMIFQDAGASFCPIRTIGDQITESMKAHKKISKKEAKAQALQLFEKLNFRDGERIWKSYPFELSGGMNQRVGIAAAMLLSPSVLLADEPTSALDAAAQSQVIQEMQHVREIFGTSILLVSHDIHMVAGAADTLLVLKDGKIMEYGRTKEILNNPRNAYTKELLEAAVWNIEDEYGTDLRSKAS